MISIEQAKLEVVAEFPKGYFLENLAIRGRRLHPGLGNEQERTLVYTRSRKLVACQARPRTYLRPNDAEHR